MNILVYDVAASRSGALSILQEYHKLFCEQAKNDGNRYFFVVSTPELAETDEVRVLRFPEIKKSWLHRWYFDHFRAPKLIDEYQIDEVLSLQNLTIPKVKVPQVLYLHQPLPFVPQRFSFWQNKRLWVNQHIISHMIYSSVREARQVIVQTQWMKDACVRICNVPAEKIVVKPPELDRSLICGFVDSVEARRTFFYPATPFAYKNHHLLLEAAKILKADGVTDYKLVFTFRGDENPVARGLREMAEKENLPVEFHGPFQRAEVYRLYAQSTLLYPSYIETFGMPLLEARLTGTPILAARMPFAEEILEGYGQVRYFEYDDVQAVCREIKENLNVQG